MQPLFNLQKPTHLRPLTYNEYKKNTTESEKLNVYLTFRTLILIFLGSFTSQVYASGYQKLSTALKSFTASVAVAGIFI